MRKTLFLLSLVLIFFACSNAQIYKPTSPLFAENLAKITQAFRNNYYSIQGEQMPSAEDMDTYRSIVSLPATKQVVIYRFHSKTDTSASWQSIMYSGDNYKDALRIYRNTCREVNKCRVILNDATPALFSGKMDEPEENLRFVSTIYTLKTKDMAYENFYAEVELLNTTFDQWEVHLNLQSKKNDDEKY